MSRYLSDALATDQPQFRHDLAELEKAHGHPNSDLRLTSEVMSGLSDSVRDLGLDPADTTPQELYAALNLKLKTDDQKLLKHLRSLAAKSVNAEANAADGIALVVKELSSSTICFALKSSSLKKLLKLNPPKKSMKALNYRSLASLLKHEPAALTLLAINNFESSKYVDNLYSKFKNFRATDFESRPLSIYQPKSRKWQEVLAQVEARTHKQVISCYELGSLILMPVDNQATEGMLSAKLVLILNELSKVMSTSTYLKLHQVNSDFGKKLTQVAEHEPMVESSLMGQPLPWHLVHSVLSSLRDIKPGADLPHLTDEDLNFSQMLDKLGDIIDDFRFWQSTSFLGLVKQGEATSLNILDVSINLCNKLSFDQRETKHFKYSLWQELMKRYIGPKILSDSLQTSFQPQLTLETAEI
jgi:hypothetical protein